MKNIRYEITFHTYWHCGSGLAAGADVDALVIKDKNNLPFIPGKTIKGLVREAVDEILGNADNNIKEEDYLDVFGYYDDNTESDKKNINNKISKAFFTNAEITDKDDIVENNLQRFLLSAIASTAIDKDGIAKDHSLRRMEVVVPAKLQGEILNVPESMEGHIKDALRFIKCLGVNRNRGLGRCTIKAMEE